MTQEQPIKNASSAKQVPAAFYKWAYGFFVVAGLCWIIFSDDFMTGVSQLGIALIFDPFDQKIRWNNRPLYQRIWLIVHVFLVLGLFGYHLFA